MQMSTGGYHFVAVDKTGRESRIIHASSMATLLPEETLLTALATYLQDALRAEADLADSEVLNEWPEPTTNLRLGDSRVVVSIIRAGASEGDDRLGGPIVERVTPGVSPKGIVRYDAGQIDQPITIGLWASTAARRNDVDLLLRELLNQPMWATIEPIVNTTLAVAITRTGEQLVTPASMADIWPGCTLQVGTTERVVVKDIRPTGFIATFKKKHAAAVTVVEVAGRRETIATGLHLRCADHFGNIATYLFDDGVATLDDAEGGRGRQRQEWRSMRNGVGSIRWTREVTAVLQKRLLTETHVSKEGGGVADPTETQVFP